MTVKFYVLQANATGTTREKFLYSDYCTEIMVGKQIYHKRKKFQVKDLEWMNEQRTELKAVCLEIKQVKK